MPRFVDRWFDPAYELPRVALAQWSLEESLCDHVEELINDAKAFYWAAQIPRRLGGDASGVALAADKKMCRAISHSLRNMILGWQRLLPYIEVPPRMFDDIGPAARQLGGQVNIPGYLLGRKLGVETQRSKAVTRLAQRGDFKLANRVAGAFTFEVAEIERLMGKVLALNP